MSELAIHPLLGLLPQQSEVRKGDIPQKINAFTISPRLNFAGMKFEFESLAQEISYRLQKSPQLHRIISDDKKVVSIANIVFNMQIMLHKLVTFVHIHIGKKLAREIAYRQSFPRRIFTLSLSRKPVAS